MIGQSARLHSRAAVVVVSPSQPLIVSRPPDSPTNSKKVGPKQCRIRRWAYVLLLFLFLSDFCQINYLNINQTDLHRICSVGRTTAVDE